MSYSGLIFGLRDLVSLTLANVFFFLNNLITILMNSLKKAEDFVSHIPEILKIGPSPLLPVSSNSLMSHRSIS